MSTDAFEDVDALALRARGYNLVVVQSTRQKEGVWERADRFGFLVLSTPTITGRVMTDLTTHPSHMGWVVESDLGTSQEQQWFKRIRSRVGGLVGVASAFPMRSLPPGVDFVVCAPELTANFADLGVPVFSVSERDA
jgi:hypothetical protein